MRFVRSRLGLIVLLAVSMAPWAAAWAQTSERGTTRLTPAVTRGADSTLLRPAGVTAVRLAAVRLVAEPGRITVVRVPLPDAVRDGGKDSTFFSVAARQEARLLGASSGIVPKSRTALILSFNVGRQLPAGASEIAVVQFRVDSTAYEVPVEFTIPRNRAVSLSTIDAAVTATPGRWTVLRARLTNRGNAPETLTVDVDALEGWRAARASPTIVPASAASDVLLRVWAPMRATIGTTMLRLLARHGDGVVAAAEVRMLVNPERDLRRDGLTLAFSSLGVLQAGSAESALAYSATLSGRLSDSVTVDARVNVSPRTNPATNFALARSGMMSMPPSVMLRGPRADLSVGVLSAPIHDPGGAYLAGIGGGGSVRLGQWQTSAFAGRPFGVQREAMYNGRGLLAGTGFARDVRTGLAGVEALHIDDRELQRGLQSVSAYLQSVPIGSGMLDVSVALRRTAIRVDPVGGVVDAALPIAGNAMSFATPLRVGAAGAYRVTGRDGAFELRALHAPAGSQGFARAGTEYTASLSRRFGWLQTSGSAWHQADENRLSGKVSSTGWYVAPSTAIRNGLVRFGLEGRGTDLSVARGGITYRNTEAAAGGLIEVNAHGVYLRSRAFGGPQRRLLGTSETSLLPATGLRMEWQNSIGMRGARGGVDLTWNRISTSGAGLVVPTQDAILLRADQLHLFTIADRTVTFTGDAQQIRVARSMPVTGMGWMWHGGVNVPVVRGLGVTMGVDRNPFMRLSTNGGVPLLYTLRLDRQQSLTAPFGGAPTRRLFLDENGNGRFDRGETPVSGVAIQCGDQGTTTDDRGRFSCTGTQAVVDIRMLPMGLVAGATASNGDIAVHRVTPVIVELRAPSIDASRLTPAELSKALVAASDASGLRWYARNAAPGRFVFDALPTGRYRIDVEQGLLNEPLTVTSAQELWVRPSPASPLITVDVRGRQTRIKVMGTTAPSPTSSTPP